MESVGARAAEETVATGSTNKGVVGLIAVEAVVFSVTLHGVVALPAPQQIVADISEKTIVAAAVVERGVAAVAIDEVVAVLSMETFAASGMRVGDYTVRRPVHSQCRCSSSKPWLGHGSPASTQHYVAITPTKLAKAYTDAGYFERNLRAIEVLIDQDTLKQAVVDGEPWRYYDLGHGLCTYEFFDQCAHRMACARCDFYRPRESSLAQLLDAKDNILRFLQQIPLTDEERAAVDGDLNAIDRLTQHLADRPTPSGQIPADLNTHRYSEKQNPGA